MSRRKLLDLIDNASEELPDNKKFLTDVMSCIERTDLMNARKPSKWYKPSSLACLRNMYFTRTQAPTDRMPTDYNSIGMADTGTRRHEAIQEVLLNLRKLGYDWEYVDVADYVEKKQAQGKCKSLIVREKVGAETLLFDSTLLISFRCDGIIRKLSTDEYFLFEFKNQVSFKYSQKSNGHIDPAHHNQVICYCTALDLDKAFVMYENRDTCNLEVPEIFEVTQEMKNNLVDRIMECESYVEKMIAPPKPEDTKVCKWCRYRTICRKVD
jgi:Domain of unknown function DUF83.